MSRAMNAEWTSFPEASAYTALEAQFGMEPAPAMQHWQGMLAAYRANKPDQFNTHVANYLKFLKAASKEELTVKSTGAELNLQTTSFEHAFNRVGPFNLASYALLFLGLEWLLRQRSGYL